MAMLSYSKRNSSLPPEIWTMVFQLATEDDRFFDTPVHVGHGVRDAVSLRDPFHIPTNQPSNSIQAFSENLRTKKAIAAVCRDWRKHSYTLLFRHIVIRRVRQLELLLDVLDQSRSKSASRFAACGLGWWVTHIKFHSFQGVLESHIRRLVTCCPRLQVFIDAAPYGFREVANGYIFRSLQPNSSIKSLEWVFGGPDIQLLQEFPTIMNNLLSIRCMTFQFAADSSLHTSLTFSCLKNLELFLSPETFPAFVLLTEQASFPSLTHLTLRTPTGRTSVSAEGIRALISFLEKFGAQLKVLTLRICPGDDMSWDDFAENAQLDDLEEPTSDRISIPRILALCPNVDDIIFSSRWLGVHRDGRFSPSSYSHQPTGRRYSGWRHANVKRIGLYDVGLSADGFSTGLAHRPCNCTPPAARSRSPLRHYYPWESPHSRGRALRDGIDESMPMLPNMTRRQCIIDHELSILIGSIPPVRDAYPSKEPRRSFPGLQSIHLLDADPTEMFDSDAPFDDLPFSRGSSPPTRSRSPGPLSLYSRVRDVPVTLDERTFWRAWSARCSNKDVKLVDGDGKIVSRYKANGDVMGGGGGGHYYNGNYHAGGGEADDDFSVSGRVGRALMRTLSGGRDSDDGRRVDGILDWIRNFS